MNRVIGFLAVVGILTALGILWTAGTLRYHWLRLCYGQDVAAGVRDE